MKTKYAISIKNTQANPIRYLIISFLIYTALDYWNSPFWLRAVIVSLLIIGFSSSIYNLGTQTIVDVFDDSENKCHDDSIQAMDGKSKFQQRLDDLAKERGVKK